MILTDTWVMTVLTSFAILAVLILYFFTKPTMKMEVAGDLFTEVAVRHLFSDPMLRCKVAINDELAGWDSGISEGDIVLFFPPVAGG